MSDDKIPYQFDENMAPFATEFYRMMALYEAGHLAGAFLVVMPSVESGQEGGDGRIAEVPYTNRVSETIALSGMMHHCAHKLMAGLERMMMERGVEASGVGATLENLMKGDRP